MEKNTLNTTRQSPETAAETCFIVTHTAHDIEGVEVYAFDTKEAAKQSVIDDARYIERNLMRHGQNPQILIDSNGNISISIDDSSRFYFWVISESTIKYQGDSLGAAPKLDIPISVVKECYIVVESNRETGTSSYAFGTEDAANRSINDSALYAKAGLERQGYKPAICIDPDCKSEVRVPGTNIHFKWEIIPSTISIQNREQPQARTEQPQVRSDEPTQVYVVMKTECKNPLKHSVFESEEDAQSYVRKDLESVKEELTQQKYKPGQFFYGNGNADLYVNSNMYFAWKIIPAVLSCDSKASKVG